MLFDEGDAALLKKWIVKRLEDISDADSDVLADYVLALLRHEQGEEEVKALCIEQLDDFLREHTLKFVEDVFAALSSKNFMSVNSTLGGASSVTPATRSTESPKTSPTSSTFPTDDNPRPYRSQKRRYVDPDAPRDDGYMPSGGRGYKAPRRGGASGPGRWTRGGADAGSSRGNSGFGAPNAFPPMPATSFPWVPPDNDPMAMFMAAQLFGSAQHPLPSVSGKAGEEKKVIKKVGQRCKDYDEKGFCMKGDMCPYEHGVGHLSLPVAEQEEYDPNHSTILTPAPRNSDHRGRGRGAYRGARGAGGRGRHGKSEFSHTGPSYDRNNTTLVIENIPQEKLTDATIREFFTTFGTITNVEIHPVKHLAIINFETWDMAKAAYDSPSPIFDNRFVKVFWFRADADPLTAEHAPDPRSYSISRTSEGEKMEEEAEKIDVEEIKRIQEERQKKYEEKMAQKKAMEEARKELEKKKEEIEREKRETKRKLMEKLAKKHAGTSTSPSPGPNGDPESVKPDTAILKAQLEMLQAEATALGINPNAPESEDTYDPYDAGAYRGSGRGRGYRGRGFAPRGRGYGSSYAPRAGYAPRGRGGAPSMKLDNRPKRVAVTAAGIKGEKDEDFRHYLINMGLEFESIDSHPEEEDTQIVTFHDRTNAEKFVYAGANIPNVGMVVMKWFTGPVIKTPQPAEDDDMVMPEAKDEVKSEIKDERMDEDSYDLADADEARWAE